MNFEFEREIGFINSQPSLAECLTSLPAVLETFQTSSIKDSTLIPPPFEQTVLSLNPCSSSQARPRSQKRASHGLLQPQPPAQPGPLAAEFPWMKEKKSSKKATQAPSSSSSSFPPSSSSVPIPAAGSPAGSYNEGVRGCWLKSERIRIINNPLPTSSPTRAPPPPSDFLSRASPKLCHAIKYTAAMHTAGVGGHGRGVGGGGGNLYCLLPPANKRAICCNFCESEEGEISGEAGLFISYRRRIWQLSHGSIFLTSPASLEFFYSLQGE